MPIATKTALAFAAFALGCVGLSAAVLVEAESAGLEAALLDRQELLTANRALVLRENLALATGELERLSRMTELDPEDRDTVPEQRVLGVAYRQTSFFNDSVELYDASGQCRWSEPEHEACRTRRVTDERWFQEALTGRRASRVFLGSTDGRGLVGIAVPVRRDDRALGVLHGVVDLHRDQMFSPPLTDELPEETQMALVRRDGVAVMRSAGVDLDDPGWQTAVRGLRHEAHGRVIVVRGDTRWVLAWTPVGHGELGLVFAWPWSALDDTSDRQLASVWRLVAGITLAALLLGFFTARRLTRPIEQLAARVRRAQHEPGVSLPPSGRKDEVGDLERAFTNLMVALSSREAEIREDRDRISRLAGELEDRVLERTRELEEAQHALLDAERLATIGRAGTVLSHELRNALNAISVAMDTLREGVPSEQQDVARHLVRTEVARLRALSDDLLTVARDPALHRRETDPAELLDTTLALVEDFAEQKDVEVALIAEPLAPAFLDHDRFLTALMNIVRNAIEAAAEGTLRRVEVCAKLDDGALVVTVHDAGPGVRPEILDRVFQPFVTGRAHGIGLGLPISQRFVQAHGGTLRATESHLGGACFEIRVPLHAPEEEPS